MREFSNFSKMGTTLETGRFLEFGPYRLDRKARVLLRDGSIVPLTPKVLDTLAALAERAGEPVSKQELLRSVWPDTFVEESNLAQNISVLRKTLGELSGDSSYIETIPKRGYRFVADVRIELDEPPRAAPSEAEPVAPRSRWFVVAAAIASMLVCGAAGFWFYRHRAGAAPTVRSLAVLPLKNLSGDPGQDYIADGMTELLTTEISKTLPVRVVSRTSVMQFRNVDKSIAVIARNLRVDAVIEGSVAAAGSRLRVTVQLIQVGSDRHLWAETYDRELSDTLVLQEEIARAVACAIKLTCAAPARNQAGRVKRSAFEAYLRAGYYLDQRNREDVARALSWYRKAIEEDPAYAAPYAGLANCYIQLGSVMIGGRPPAESRKLAMAAAQRALDIDPELAEAHAALAYANLFEWNWEAAQQGLERAIQLNPNYALAHMWLALHQTERGHFDRGIQEARLAADLDPLSPIIQTQVAWLLGHARRFPEAIQQYRRVLVDNPDYQWALWQFGGALIDTNDYDSAIKILERAAEISGRSASSLGMLGRAYAVVGRRADAQRLIDELLARSRDQYVPAHALTHIYIGLGERDKAFESLEREYRERSNSLVSLGVGSLWDPLRSDLRFDTMLRRVGLK